MTKIIYNGELEKIGIKQAYPEVMRELFEEDSEVINLDCDLMNSIGTLPLSHEMPDRCINCGIQEANMIGIASGLSYVGKKVYAHTFGCFASRRCFDQAFLSVGYSKQNVKIVGTDPGICAAYNGGTHMPFEDVALYRSVPGAMIADIVDSVQFKYTMKNTKDRPGLTYIRTPRGFCKAVYPEGTTFEEGKALVLKEGSDVVIIAAGRMLSKGLDAANILAEEGISAAVIDPYTIKPLDGETILKYAKQCGAVVTAENANLMGGLGDAVSSLVSGSYPVPVKRVGVEDRYGQVGPEDFLAEEYKLTKEEIVLKAKEAIKAKKQ